MKPKPLFRAAFFVAAFVMCLLLIVSKSKPGVACVSNKKDKTAPAGKIVSNNDFILFEAISKYLFISVSK